MIFKGRTYYSDTSDILVEVIKIAYVGEKYIKAKIRILYKDRMECERPKYYKLYKCNINHWKRLL